MKSLSTLIKLQKMLVDEQRQVLARLQDRVVQIIESIATLEVEMAREQVAAEQNDEARATYGAFLKAAVDKGRALEKERVAAVQAVELARDKLMQLFEEQKRYEIAEEARRNKEDAEERHRETNELDEVGSVQFTRQRE